MSDLGGWATETINKLVKFDLSDQPTELIRLMDSVGQLERKAIYTNIEWRSHESAKRVTSLIGMTRYNDIPQKEIEEQKARAHHWENMFNIAKRYV